MIGFTSHTAYTGCDREELEGVKWCRACSAQCACQTDISQRCSLGIAAFQGSISEEEDEYDGEEEGFKNLARDTRELSHFFHDALPRPPLCPSEKRCQHADDHRSSNHEHYMLWLSLSDSTFTAYVCCVSFFAASPRQCVARGRQY